MAFKLCAQDTRNYDIHIKLIRPLRFLEIETLTIASRSYKSLNFAL